MNVYRILSTHPNVKLTGFYCRIKKYFAELNEYECEIRIGVHSRIEIVKHDDLALITESEIIGYLNDTGAEL